MSCSYCAVGYHWQCYIAYDSDSTLNCCCEIDSNSISTLGAVASSNVAFPKLSDGLKDLAKIKDLTSTGRKRAAQLYPIFDNMICEWRELQNAGGGVVPIIGCKLGIATDRHHGPDKNVLNNAPNNVWRICADCHNRWHACNDRYYGPRPAGNLQYVPTEPYKEHDSETKATDKQIAESMMWFQERNAKRPYSEYKEAILLNTSKSLTAM